MGKLGNKSSAVVEQRHEPEDSLDDFPTPPWATRLFLAEILTKRFGDLSKLTAWEPTCNRGYMARPMAEVFSSVVTSDVADYGWRGQQYVADFLSGPVPAEVTADGVDWIMFNPPFALGEEFIARALSLRPRCGVAIIVRTAFLEGEERFDNLFSKFKPWLVVPSSQRIPMYRGRYNPEGSTATSYSWFVWRTGWNAEDALLTWTPKYRDRYKRPTDVNFETRDKSDWITKSIADSPLFAHEGGR